eukprot:763576-Hanusia_phi.AAC.1
MMNQTKRRESRSRKFAKAGSSGIYTVYCPYLVYCPTTPPLHLLTTTLLIFLPPEIASHSHNSVKSALLFSPFPSPPLSSLLSLPSPSSLFYPLFLPLFLSLRLFYILHSPSRSLLVANSSFTPSLLSSLLSSNFYLILSSTFDVFISSPLLSPLLSSPLSSPLLSSLLSSSPSPPVHYGHARL